MYAISLIYRLHQLGRTECRHFGKCQTLRRRGGRLFTEQSACDGAAGCMNGIVEHYKKSKEGEVGPAAVAAPYTIPEKVGEYCSLQ